MSLPIAAKQQRPPTAAALPPLLPPGTRQLFAASASTARMCRPIVIALDAATAGGDQGFPHALKCEKVVADPMANSSVFVLPTRTAPPSTRDRATEDARLAGGAKLASISLAAVVRVPPSQKLSFTATGMPSSGPNVALPSDRDRRASEARACAIALAAVTVMNALPRA